MVRKWHGQWIWAAKTALAGPTAAQPYGSLDPSRFDARVLFRRTFLLESAPREAALLRITADSRYLLFVNGQEIGSGPVRHGGRWLSFDEYDVGAALHPGTNVIAVLARFYGHAVPWWAPSPPSYSMGGGGLVAELELDASILGTDEMWRFLPGDAWLANEPASMLLSQIPETLDARLLPENWHSAYFDDSGWASARVLAEHSVVGPVGRSTPPTEPWGALRPRPIPALTGETRFARVIDSRQLESSVVAGRVDTESSVVAGRGIAEGIDATTLDPRAAIRAALASGASAASLGTETSSSLIVADFGAIVSGHLDIALGAEPGDLVTGALLELPTASALGSSSAFRYTARGRSDRIQPGDPVGGRYLVLLVETAKAVSVESIAVHERHRPRAPVRPFVSDDERLDEIYRVALRTVDLTAHDAYIDCPTREQRAWTGDAVVHQSVDLIANRDWSLARWNPQLLAEPRSDGLLPMVVAGDFATTQVPTIPDWSLHWIRSVHNLYRYAGDRDLVAELMPTAERVLRWFEPYSDFGVLSNVPGWVLIDWSPVQVSGGSAALTALWARGLKDFAEMAEWLGDTGRGRWARGLHSQVVEGFDRFWDAGRRAYRDTILDGVLGSSVSEHTAAAAVCAGLVPETHRADVLSLLRDRAVMFTDSPLSDHGSDAAGPAAGRPVSVREAPDWDTETLVVGAQPFFRYVVHDALAVLGAADDIARLCLDWVDLLREAPTALRECWEGGSYCHGWSATPARDLMTYTLGITPAQPGYKTVRVAPRLGHLTRASGQVPTPHGPVTVEVNRTTVLVHSPVPIEVVRRDGSIERLPAGTATTTI